ncbi:MAG: FtsX-like permease family protein [Anaerolineae bacterium]|nr:FtsX-like permease family protein [Anaerolineae bacterium]
MKRWLLWMRWSWRDLRLRWLQVVAIALIIALGTGIYSGLISTSPWRQQSNDASYALLNMYDLRLSLTQGSYLDQTELLNAVSSIDHADWITATEPRLILPTLVDASSAAQSVIVPGRLIGTDTGSAQTRVNDLYITGGHGLEGEPADAPVAVLEHKFAAFYELPPQGDIRLSGDRSLRYVGTGLSPEYFVVFTDEGGMMAEANFAVVFLSLQTAQTLVERPGMVNDVLFTLAADADSDTLRAELAVAVDELANVGASFMVPQDDPAYNMLYEDIAKDELFWRAMAYLFLAGAVFGAFNLATRLVEAQRREIGIQMALGVMPRWIAIRPLLVAVQIAVLGVVFGLIIGVFVGDAFGDLLQTMMPLPISLQPFQPRIFLEAAALGIALPLLATLFPVLRALRVEPVDAIRTGHLVAKGGGFAPLLARRASSRVLTWMPLRNLLCAPRRALLTLLGIAAAITLLVLIMGMLDSFAVTLDQARVELLQANPERMLVQLNFFYPENSPIIANISQSPVVSGADASLKLGGYMIHDDTTVETLLDMVDMTSTLWRPSLASGSYPGERPGVLISAIAARDLGVQPGDTITLRHPQRTGLLSYGWAESEVEVSGIHPLPLRFQTYMDFRQAEMMGLAGLVNALQVTPAPGVTQDQVQQALFDQFGVASVQPVSAVIRVFEDLIGEFVAIFSVMQVAAVILAVLIAYNSTSINIDERRRDMATMFAFGTRVRTALRVEIVEHLLTSIFGTALGCVLGFAFLVVLLTQVFDVVIPDIEMTITVQPLTLLVALVIGVLVAVLTPILNLRKLIGMDIPSTLRVME